jgi:DNA repair protein RadC
MLKPMFASIDREQFIVLCVDSKNRPIGVNIVSIGSLAATIVHPREVFKAAILLNASGIFLAHNHPSGECNPSQEDKELTARLKLGADLLGIRLIDHIILGEDAGGGLNYYSFADEGQL